MVRSMMRVATVALALTMAGPVLAKKAPAKKMAAKSVTCPVCHMPMTTTKNKVNTRMVKFNGKTYYCCTVCKMPAVSGSAKKAK